VFISGGNPHITSQFCGVVTTISKMVSEHLQDSLGHLLSGSAIGPPTIYVHEPSPIVLVVRGCVKSPTSDRTWHDKEFISGSNPHLTSRFCGVVLGPTTISKKIWSTCITWIINLIIIMNEWIHNLGYAWLISSNNAWYILHVLSSRSRKTYLGIWIVTQSTFQTPNSVYRYVVPYLWQLDLQTDVLTSTNSEPTEQTELLIINL